MSDLPALWLAEASCLRLRERDGVIPPRLSTRDRTSSATISTALCSGEVNV